MGITLPEHAQLQSQINHRPLGRIKAIGEVDFGKNYGQDVLLEIFVGVRGGMQMPLRAAGGVDVYNLRIGDDVTQHAVINLDPSQLLVGALVGVRRSDGRVTVGRVDPQSQPGFVHVTLSLDGSWKDVPLDYLYALPPIKQVAYYREPFLIPTRTDCTLDLKLGIIGFNHSLACQIVY